MGGVKGIKEMKGFKGLRIKRLNAGGMKMKLNELRALREGGKGATGGQRPQ
jgi:hypothetical protein